MFIKPPGSAPAEALTIDSLLKTIHPPSFSSETGLRQEAGRKQAGLKLRKPLSCCLPALSDAENQPADETPFPLRGQKLFAALCSVGERERAPFWLQGAAEKDCVSVETGLSHNNTLVWDWS